MSLIVTLYVPEGIVIAGDSRLTLNWVNPTDQGQQMLSASMSDSFTKIFSINNKFGLGTFGAADINGIPISGFINQFHEEKVKPETNLEEMPQLLLDFFGEKFGYPAINFYLVGYNIENGISVQHVYHINIAAKNYSRKNFVNGQTNHGATWGGETEILSRILNSAKVKQNENWIDLPDTQIPWNYMTLQDAIDFSVYAIRTTIETMRFQQRMKTVGGPIDILVIKPNEAPIWINKKVLHYGLSDRIEN
jgi:20S proteasome alpha/beta subunit